MGQTIHSKVLFEELLYSKDNEVKKGFLRVHDGHVSSMINYKQSYLVPWCTTT